MESRFAVELVAGGCAGFAVDVALFPLDTLKTRAQSPQVFLLRWLSEAFTMVFSPRQLALCRGRHCFATYSKTKSLMGKEKAEVVSVHHHMVAASVAETFACLVRVPTENVKQSCRPAYFHQLAKHPVS